MDAAARGLDERMAALAVSRPGQRKREPTATELDVLRRYWRTGRPVAAMAQAFGVAENTLRRWVREAGI